MTGLAKLYTGSVKDVLGPALGGRAVVFDYTDAYSVFDWGKMPDPLPRKGEALALMAAHLFERLETPQAWAEFSKTAEALKLRKGSRFGADFQEVGEKLQKNGLKTHYLGLLESTGPEPVRLASLRGPTRQMLVKRVEVIPPAWTRVMGRMLPDYSASLKASAPKLIPLEVVFRFSAPPGSSLLSRVERDPEYLPSIGYVGLDIKPGVTWDFPVLELFTKLEPSDRHLALGEAIAMSGLEPSQFQELMFRTAWVAGFLRAEFARAGLELADGKLEWALGESGELWLVDAIGPDELRILKGGVQLSKEFLRLHYRKTPWFEALTQAKEKALKQGVAEWKKSVGVQPPVLPHATRDLASHVYLALARELIVRSPGGAKPSWLLSGFQGVPDLTTIIDKIGAES